MVSEEADLAAVEKVVVDSEADSAGSEAAGSNLPAAQAEVAVAAVAVTVVTDLAAVASEGWAAAGLAAMAEADLEAGSAGLEAAESTRPEALAEAAGLVAEAMAGLEAAEAAGLAEAGLVAAKGLEAVGLVVVSAKRRGVPRQCSTPQRQGFQVKAAVVELTRGAGCQDRQRRLATVVWQQTRSRQHAAQLGDEVRRWQHWCAVIERTLLREQESYGMRNSHR